MEKIYSLFFGFLIVPSWLLCQTSYDNIFVKIQNAILFNKTPVSPINLEKLESMNFTFLIPFYSYSIAILAGLFLLYSIINKIKQNKGSFELLYASDEQPSQKEDKSVKASKSTQTLKDAMSSDTEKHILNGLKKFESKKEFTNKGITLAYLAAELETNVRYLSEVVKKHKAENFKTYIHILRINFVINKLEKDSLYRKYKVSHLADISGFPTSALFTKVFKEITGYTPTAYLSMLSERDKANEKALKEQASA
ncbi:helix-turn-helix domain-containing protein [Chryseobacterium sp. Alg-005]|uniref:helix-turn-helix domain-containing protein n=1 Tax=Chryseobacterium sp. Alg-005 TaxID=3159516 RepID=UPI0036F2AD78